MISRVKNTRYSKIWNVPNDLRMALNTWQVPRLHWLHTLKLQRFILFHSTISRFLDKRLSIIGNAPNDIRLKVTCQLPVKSTATPHRLNNWPWSLHGGSFSRWFPLHFLGGGFPICYNGVCEISGKNLKIGNSKFKNIQNSPFVRTDQKRIQERFRTIQMLFEAAVVF